MPKTKISEFSATAGNNTDIDGINIAEGCPPSGINDAIRELMSQLKDFQAGTAGDSFNGPVGTTTPAAGAFTNLSASGTFALTGDQVQISEGGTGQTTANAAFNALAPSQSTHAGKYLKTDGTNTSWDAIEINTADITGTLPIANGGTGLTALGTGVQTALGQNVTGSGGIVLASSPTLTTPNLGTPSAVTLTNATGLPLSTGVTGTLATTNGGTGLTSFTANGVVYASSTSALTTGSALTFDGTNFATTGKIGAGGSPGLFTQMWSTGNIMAVDGSQIGFLANSGGAPTNYMTGSSASNFLAWVANNAEQMRLTTTGLGIGTSSPAFKLSVQGNAIIAGSNPFLSFGASASSGSTPTYIERNGTTGLQTFYNNGTGTNGAMAFFIGGGSEGMRLDSSGNLGIGTSSPQSDATYGGLTLNGANGSIFTLRAGGSNAARIYTTATDNINIDSNGSASGYIAFRTGTGSTERMRLDSSGNLGIGTSSPAYKLHISGSGAQAAQITSTSGSASVILQNFTGAGNYAYIQYNGHSGSGLQFYDTTNVAARMTLDSSGNLGLGTTNPSLASGMGIAVYNSTVGGAARIALKNGSTGDAAGDGFQLVASGVDAYIEQRENGFLAFTTNNAERARITSGGSLLVGTTTSDGYLFKVEGSYPFLSKGTGGAALTSMSLWNDATTGDNIFVVFSTEAGGTTRGSIDYNRAGGLVRYNTTSDYRAKDIIGPVQNTGTTIDALKVYEGVMKGATQARPMMIAHEAQEVVPFCVSGAKDETNEDGTPKYQQMDHASLVPLLIAELQSLRARVAQLEGASA